MRGYGSPHADPLKDARMKQPSVYRTIRSADSAEGRATRGERSEPP